MAGISEKILKIKKRTQIIANVACHPAQWRPRNYPFRPQAHIWSGETFKLSKALSNVHTFFGVVFDITAILSDSPQNPLYIFQPKGTGEQNRAYLDIETNQIYEWSFVPGTKTRQVRFYESYDKINKEWRGVGYKNSQYFDQQGSPVPQL